MISGDAISLEYKGLLNYSFKKVFDTFFVQVDNSAIHVAADKGHYGVLELLLSSEAFAKNPEIIGKQNKVQVFKFCLGQGLPFWVGPTYSLLLNQKLKVHVIA